MHCIESFLLQVSSCIDTYQQCPSKLKPHVLGERPHTAVHRWAILYKILGLSRKIWGSKCKETRRSWKTLSNYALIILILIYTVCKSLKSYANCTWRAIIQLFTKWPKFGLDQIESIYRWHITFKWNTDFSLWLGKTHYGKRRKCWLPAFPPFLRMYSKVYCTRECVVQD